MPTKYGVEYDLTQSKYKVTVNAFTFYFSSPSHRKRFLDGVHAKVDWLCDSLSRRFKYMTSVENWAVFRLYTEIETRGFLVEVDGVKYQSPDYFEFTGDVVMRNAVDYGA